MISGRTGDQKWRTFARTVLNSGKDAPLPKPIPPASPAMWRQ
jgi:hypothetical protein